MKRPSISLAWLSLLMLWGCAREPSSQMRKDFLKTSMSPTGAYEVNYVDRPALDRAVKSHGEEAVLFELEQELRRNWGFIDNQHGAQYAFDLIQAMESVKLGAGKDLLGVMTDEATRERQTSFRELWMEQNPRPRTKD